MIKIVFNKSPLAPIFQRGRLLVIFTYSVLVGWVERVAKPSIIAVLGFATRSTQPTSLLVIFLLSGNSYAEDSLSSLMQRMQSNTAVKMAYQEIRTLELIDQPWHGSGYMYSIAPDLMIREQLKPQRLLMGIKGDKMFYFDPELHIHHQSEMDEDNPLSLNIAVFKALINADEALLKRMYSIEFSSKPERWLMTLKSKQQSQSGFSIVVSGLTDKPADTIITRQADGDLSEFMLQQSAQGDEVKKTATQLYKELIGK